MLGVLTREGDELSVYPKRRKTMDLYIKEREGKPNADCQSLSPMPTAKQSHDDSIKNQRDKSTTTIAIT